MGAGDAGRGGVVGARGKEGPQRAVEGNGRRGGPSTASSGQVASPVCRNVDTHPGLPLKRSLKAVPYTLS